MLRVPPTRETARLVAFSPTTHAASRFNFFTTPRRRSRNRTRSRGTLNGAPFASRCAMARFVLGVLFGAALATAVVAYGQEPSVTVKNGVLEGWTVARDDETILCEDPTVFVRARQIQCP